MLYFNKFKQAYDSVQTNIMPHKNLGIDREVNQYNNTPHIAQRRKPYHTENKTTSHREVQS